MYVKDLTLGMKKALENREQTMKVVSEIMKVPVPVLETYLLKENDFARRPMLRPTFRRSRRCSTRTMPRDLSRRN
jgi:NitT/TauT family transport system substrate-binding protein/sulfonate transport system substrate-binding protein